MTTPRFARRMSNIRASEIRELLKLTERPEVISFAGGLPAPELFPIKELEEIAVAVLEREGREALQYSTTEGHPALRAAIAARMTARLGIPATPEQVLITSGSQQGLDFSGKVFLDEGDEVLCESPTYLGAINAFRAYQPRFVEVVTDDDGMELADLERALAGCRNPKLIYVVPDFQNPTGRTWSLERRRGLLEVARRAGVPVLEDAPYTELRYDGPRLPSLAALDRDGLVIYLGTFSKIFCPGLRLGWVAAPEQILHRFVLVKQGADLHTSTLSQRQLTAYLERHDIDANIERMRALCRGRRDAMLAALEREMPAGLRWTRPQGGLFVWVELPAGVDARALLERCLEHDVAFVPGGSFFPNGGHLNTLRLNFSFASEERITEGVARLGRALADALGALATAV